MDHVAVLALFDRDMREGARPDSPGARVERVDKVVRQVGTEQGWNGVIWSDLDESIADAAIAEQMRYFGGLGREFEWKLYGHDRPEDLGKRLRAAGFVAQPEETLMIAELGDLALDAQPPEGVRLLPVTDRAGVDLVADVHEQAFGTDSTRMRHQLLAQLTGDENNVVAVVALAGDVPVSAARMEMVPGTRFAGLGRRHRRCLARPRHLPRPGGPPRPCRRRARLPLRPGRRHRPEPPGSRPPGLRTTDHDDAVRVRMTPGRRMCRAATSSPRAPWASPPVSYAHVMTHSMMRVSSAKPEGELGMAAAEAATDRAGTPPPGASEDSRARR